MIDYEEISTEDQKKYQCRVGILLHFVMNSRPDIANATMKHFKSNDGVNPASFK